MTIVSDFNCPACGHKLRKENTACKTVWLHCGNPWCKSRVCDNGQDGVNEYEAYMLLVYHQQTEELPNPEPPELSIDDEREQEEARWGDMELDRQKGEP